jgi:hypothetical protein
LFFKDFLAVRAATRPAAVKSADTGTRACAGLNSSIVFSQAAAVAIAAARRCAL